MLVGSTDRVVVVEGVCSVVSTVVLSVFSCQH